MAIRTLIPVSIGALALAAAASAEASPQFKQTVEGGLVSRIPDQPAGLGYRVRIADPGAPDELPKRATKIIIRSPAGTVYNPRGAPSCTLAEAMANGDCPRDTRLFHVINGDGMWVSAPGITCRFNARIFHLRGRNTSGSPGGLLFFHDGSCRPGLGSTATLSKNGTITIPLHPNVYTPPATLTQFILAIGRRVRDGKALLRTPDSCNRRRGWKSRTTVTYEDGSTETTITKRPCGRRR